MILHAQNSTKNHKKAQKTQKRNQTKAQNVNERTKVKMCLSNI